MSLKGSISLDKTQKELKISNQKKELQLIFVLRNTIILKCQLQFPSTQSYINLNLRSIKSYLKLELELNQFFKIRELKEFQRTFKYRKEKQSASLNMMHSQINTRFRLSRKSTVSLSTAKYNMEMEIQQQNHQNLKLLIWITCLVMMKSVKKLSLSLKLEMYLSHSQTALLSLSTI